MDIRSPAPLQAVRRFACLLFAGDDDRAGAESAFSWLSADPVFAAAPVATPAATPMAMTVAATVAATVAEDESSVAAPRSSRRRAALA